MREKLYKTILEKLEKDLVDYSKEQDMKDMKKDMKKGAKEVKKDLEKYAREVEKDQEKDSKMGFQAPSDISFTGTDAYTYIKRDYRSLSQKQIQHILDQQAENPPWLLSSFASRK
jgi:hypothetical protein